MLSKNPKDRPSILEFLNRPVIRKRAQVYLKQAYDILLKSAHDKELLNSLLQQASKLKISLEN